MPKAWIIIVLIAIVGLFGGHQSVAAPRGWSSSPAYSTPADHPSTDFKIIDENGVPHVLYAKSRAILVFEANYEHQEAWGSVPDAATENETALRDALEARGFQVEVWRDLKGAQLSAQLSEVFSRYGHMGDGRLFFYYFGHGYKMGSTDGSGARTFLVPVDAVDPTSDQDGFLSAAIQISQLVEYARQATTKHIFFALEACKAGSIIESLAGPEPVAPMGYLLSKELQRPARQFLTAGSPDRDVPAKGIFTKTFIDGLTKADINHDGFVTGTELMAYVALKVPLRAFEQHPEKGDIRQLGGDFVFGPVSPGNVPTVARQTDPSLKFALCSHPDNGLERWSKTEVWNADSDWRSGGSDPQSYCGSQKLAREAKWPNRNIVLGRTGEDHRVTYNPFKHDEYRYTCTFTDQWDPIYKTARSKSCGLADGG